MMLRLKFTYWAIYYLNINLLLFNDARKVQNKFLEILLFGHKIMVFFSPLDILM